MLQKIQLITADVLRTRQCNRLLKDYSTEAKAVWEREEDDLLARHQECGAISTKVFSEADGFPAGSEIRPVPWNQYWIQSLRHITVLRRSVFCLARQTRKHWRFEIDMKLPLPELWGR